MNTRIGRLLSINPISISIVIMIVSLTLFFFDPSFLRFMELKALDLRMVSRGKILAGKETVIVALDEKSLSELGRWPWPRTLIARLVEKLKSYGAKAIGFDIVFAEPDQHSGTKIIDELTGDIERSGLADKQLMALLEKKKADADPDSDLAEAIKKADNVTLGFFFHTSKQEAAHLAEKTIEQGIESLSGAKYSLVKKDQSIQESVIITAYAAAPNLKILSDASRQCGYFNAIPDSDGVIRWSPLVIKCRGNYFTSLSLSLISQYYGAATTLHIGEFGVAGIQVENTSIPTDEMGRMLINYRGPAGTFPHYSFTDILHDRISAEALKDKIVLVGVTATGVYDQRVTPFSAAYPGVEIHANVIDNILHQNFFNQSWWIRLLDILSIMASSLMMGLIIPRFTALRGMWIGLLLISAFVIMNMLLFSRYSVWLNLIYPVLAMLVVYVVITVYRYRTEEREKKKIRNAFQYYLTASVINEMLRDPTKLKLGGDKRQLTVMFSDIRGFTTISEQLSPEDLVQLLNEYLTAMTEIIFTYDGLLDKYMGDAIMAIYGAPLDQPDHALRACEAALEMLQCLRKLQSKWSHQGRPYMDMGIGINTGDMVVGNMGSQMRFDYTAMGDNVNLGSRLEGLNKEYGTNIIISEFTYAIVKNELFCRELDAVRVVGRKQPIKIYELLCYNRDAGQYQESIALFKDGLAKYKNALWEEAISLFQNVQRLKPDDHPATVYIRRCQVLKNAPPVLPWDGVYTMTNK